MSGIPVYNFRDRSNLFTEEQPPQVRLVDGWQMGITNLLRNLGTFIIKKQPPQVGLLLST